MNKRIDRRAQVTEKIAQHILQEGLAKTSLRQLAAAADLSDRMLLYYFTDKADVMSSALAFLAQGMKSALNVIVSEDQELSPSAFFEKIADLINSPMFGPFMALWIEISAAAVRGEEPYKQVSHEIAMDFLGWIEDRIIVEKEQDRKSQAAMLLSMIDGLVLLRICTNEAVQAAAIQAMSKALRLSPSVTSN